MSTYNIVCSIMSYFRAMTRSFKLQRTPAQVVGIWSEPFEQRAHLLGLESSEGGCEPRFFVTSPTLKNGYGHSAY